LGVRHPQDSSRKQTVNILFMRKNQKIVVAAAVVHSDPDLTYF
jgi:hypothetical protein